MCYICSVKFLGASFIVCLPSSRKVGRFFLLRFYLFKDFYKIIHKNT